ncbi:MAG: hypothetical protein Q8P44_01565, partial [Dehalococcoidia bacterium]|nr:hypothetical protein [Dehalococcoidia bacterium]
MSSSMCLDFFLPGQFKKEPKRLITGRRTLKNCSASFKGTTIGKVSCCARVLFHQGEQFFLLFLHA